MNDPILQRRTIRKYTADPVSDEYVERLLRAAMAAPSASNQQPWQFIVVRERSLLEAVPGFHPFSAMVPHAALAILVCSDSRLPKQPRYWVQDCAAATQNILLAATQLGLGAVWLGVHPVQERIDGFRALLGIPGHIDPFAMVAVGWPAEEKPPSDRYDEQRVHHDRW